MCLHVVDSDNLNLLFCTFKYLYQVFVLRSREAANISLQIIVVLLYASRCTFDLTNKDTGVP